MNLDHLIYRTYVITKIYKSDIITKIEISLLQTLKITSKFHSQRSRGGGSEFILNEQTVVNY